MRWIQTLTFLIAVLLLAACESQLEPAEPAKPALPTSTPVPTFTPTPGGATAADGGGQASTQTQEQTQPTAPPAPAAPTDTPTPQVPLVTIGATIMNVRGGPGINYNVIGTASPGQQFPILGKNPGLGDWWQIDFSGQLGWIYGPFVTSTNAGNVQVAGIIPAPPPPTATPIPPPTPIPAPTQPPAPSYPYRVASQGVCNKHDSVTTFIGFTKYRSGELKNDVCVHFYSAPVSDTKCSGCPSSAGSHARWEFTPFGVAPKGKNLHDKVRGIYVEIYVIACPQELQPSGRPGNVFTSKDFSNLTPLSEKWTKTLPESQQCEDITFQEN